MIILFVTSAFALAATAAVRAAFSGFDHGSWILLPGFDIYVEKPEPPPLVERPPLVR